MIQNQRYQKGITLIALVVTIVVLLILAGVSIAMLTGENGIIKQAEEAKINTRGSYVKEAVQMAINENKMLDYSNTAGTKKTKQDVIDKLKQEGNLTDKEVEELKTEDIIKIGEIEVDFSGLVPGNENDDIISENLGVVPEIDEEAMTPVKYDETKKEWVEADPTIPGDWFDYSIEEKKWANVETENGYFVYIPRYAYKITSGYHQSLDTAGTMAIVFLNGDNTLKSTTDSEGNTVSESDLIHASDVNSAEAGVGLNATTKYIIHPAFEAFDTADKKVDGLWVAKYEMSREDKQQDGTWQQTEIMGNVATSANIRMVSKPGVSRWSNIRATTIFANCYNMNRALDSHMMKNTEWGAVAYLTVSQHGKGATNEVEQNKSSSYLTGYGADSTLSTGAASTTGNMYGIFDMSGGGVECVAGYLEDECMAENGGSLYSYNANLVNAEAKYKDVYQIGVSSSYEDCCIANNLKVGDALWEIAINDELEDGWFRDDFWYIGMRDIYHYPVISRGGNYDYSGTDAGVLGTNLSTGQGVSGFRVVCVVN